MYQMSFRFENLCDYQSWVLSIVTPRLKYMFALNMLYVFEDFAACVHMIMYVFYQFFRGIRGMCACVSCNLAELLQGEFL